MFHYILYTKKDGKNIVVSENRSTFPPDDERGQTAIANFRNLVQKAEFKGAYAVAVVDMRGVKTWFDRQGQAALEENAFGEYSDGV